MKEIKFRAWDKLNEHFIYITLPVGYISWGDYKWKADNMGPWQQYTGYKDNNGVDIFEGDIVKAENATGEVKRGRNGCIIERIKGELYPEPLYEYYDPEVIGNIHENPELLK